MTPKQELFAQAYLETSNASEAYKRAYDTQANANTINRKASQLLKHPEVIKLLAELKADARQRHKLTGGYRLAGKTAGEAMEIIEEAKGAEEAGAFAVVVEFTAWEVAREITRRLSIPTICIGSGPYCDGQVVVLHDILGLTENPPPFTRKYADIAEEIRRAVESYARDVREGRFPSAGMYWGMKRGEYEKLTEKLRAETGATR